MDEFYKMEKKISFTKAAILRYEATYSRCKGTSEKGFTKVIKPTPLQGSQAPKLMPSLDLCARKNIGA